MEDRETVEDRETKDKRNTEGLAQSGLSEKRRIRERRWKTDEKHRRRQKYVLHITTVAAYLHVIAVNCFGGALSMSRVIGECVKVCEYCSTYCLCVLQVHRGQDDLLVICPVVVVGELCFFFGALLESV